MKVIVKIYDTCKYEKESKITATADYDIKGYEVKIIPAEEMLASYDMIDEYDEYLILHLEDGDTATFRNSHTDMFRA